MDEGATKAKSTPGGRILEVLDAFAAGESQQTLDQVQEATGLPRSTAYRTLRILITHQWLTHAKGGYSVDEKALQFAQRFNRELVRSAASSGLNELQLASGAVAHLSVLEGPMVCHLDKVGGLAWKDIPSHIGTRLPAVNTAAGRAIIGCLTSADMEEIFRRHDEAGLPKFDKGALRAELLASRSRKGLLTRDGSKRPSGISTAAAPVLLKDAAIASISLAWRGEQISTARAGKLVLSTAHAVSLELQELVV